MYPTFMCISRSNVNCYPLSNYNELQLSFESVGGLYEFRQTGPFHYLFNLLLSFIYLFVYNLREHEYIFSFK